MNPFESGVLFPALAAIFFTAFVFVTAAWGRQIRDTRQLTKRLEQVIGTGSLPERTSTSGSAQIKGLEEAVVSLLSWLGALQQTAEVQFNSVRVASTQLNDTAERMEEVVSTHAAALQETQVTAEQLGRTSATAAEKARSVIEATNRAEAVGRDGERDLDLSVEGLDDVQSQADVLGNRISALLERTRQIGAIVETVRDLADQSNMLALNASVEAVRAGEHGKGFAVVAREVRTLADRSLQAARQVKQLVAEVDTSIAEAANMSNNARDRVVSGLDQVRTSAERLRELTSIVRESAGAARQIAAAVAQQDEGIRQLFEAVRTQGDMMEVSVDAVRQTSDATRALEEAVLRIASANPAHQVA